jgi:hypothetical protein
MVLEKHGWRWYYLIKVCHGLGMQHGLEIHRSSVASLLQVSAASFLVETDEYPAKHGDGRWNLGTSVSASGNGVFTYTRRISP